MRLILGTAAAILLAAAASHAQSFTTGPCDDRAGHSYNSNEVRVCELRSATLPLVNGHLALAGKNGGIDVIGEDRSDIRLEAQVEAQAATRDEAEALERKIEIVTSGEIHANGPEQFIVIHQSQWSVNYRLNVPRHLAAQLHTLNGSVKLASLDGAITAETTNGSMTLTDLAGDVNAHTTNGSLHISLQGSQWKGTGLTAHTTNGSVNVSAPSDYSAHLVAQTTNGSLRVGLPIASSQEKHSHRIDTTVGQGGATLSFATVNGSLHFDRN